MNLTFWVLNSTHPYQLNAAVRDMLKMYYDTWMQKSFVLSISGDYIEMLDNQFPVFSADNFNRGHTDLG